MSSGRPKPKLRGVFHFIGFFVALAAGVALVVSPLTGRAYAGGLVYAGSLVLMLGLSALYHRPMWGHGARRILRRFDHSGIFFLIAGTFTAFWTNAPPDLQVPWQLGLMWGCAALGVPAMVFWTDMPRALRAAIFVGMGLATLPMAVSLPRFVGWDGMAGVLGGGAVYIAGAGVYARRWPNPDPRVFGYHEVFHAMVLLAAAMHFAVVARMHWGGAA